jgi:hypothetical protein
MNFVPVWEKLLYLLKHSRPDLSNSVRELSKVLDDTEETHYKAMKRCIKFVLDTKAKGLKIAPDAGKEMLTGICDASFAPDKNTRRSITGWMILLFGTLISWKSKMQKGVTISSTEAEYVAISEMCMELMFIKQVLESMQMEVITPIKVYTDNLGAIYMIKNWTTGGKTKHVDTRFHYVRDLERNHTIELSFVRTDENQANMLTKNVGEEEYWKMINNHMEDIA